MISKLTIFSFVGGLVKAYLKVFQSDHPMVPFIYSEVKSVIIVEKSKTATDLKNIDISSEENLLPIKDAEMGFGKKNKLNELIKKDNVL